MTAITLNLEPAIYLTDEQFYQLCQANRDVRFERRNFLPWLLISLSSCEKCALGGSPRCSNFSRERSATDELKPLRAKMQEYRDNGVRLGWLIDPQRRIVEIYRIGTDVEVIQSWFRHGLERNSPTALMY